jgi:hypothetical protein
MFVCEIKTKCYSTTEEVLELVRAFEAGTLARERWTHEAHLVIALWHVSRHPLPRATRLIREGIKCYNEAHGIRQTPDGGYHETLTLFWIKKVYQFLVAIKHREGLLLTLANELVKHYAEENLPLVYYSRELLFSSEARARWVEPDLKRLDEARPDWS